MEGQVKQLAAFLLEKAKGNLAVEIKAFWQMRSASFKSMGWP